ncbi:conserved hypothetical protein [Ricinus communis]|uniref:Uncharacterized protein n=1 Tax=Ricinus communis TaxID=3988 RepID=B9SGG0_RICCO|nr:conserved hypothetical protein [Ricinus communis]
MENLCHLQVEMRRTSTIEIKEVAVIDHRGTSMEPIIQYLSEGIVPKDKKEARKLVAKVVR